MNRIRIVFFFSFLVFSLNAIANNEITDKYLSSLRIANVNPDKAIQNLEECAMGYNNSKDTINLLECTLSLIEIQRLNQSFSKAYNNAWNILPVAEKQKDKSYAERVYENLGILYSIFGQEKQSEIYFMKALNIRKGIYENDSSDIQTLISRYYNLLIINNQFLKPDVAGLYLDSCMVLSGKANQDSVKKGYLYTELANSYLIKGEYQKTQEIITPLIDLFESIEYDSLNYKNDKSYLVILYNLLGDAYAWQGNDINAINNYKKSIKAIEKYNSHKQIKADLLYKLSQMYAENQNFDEAYYTLNDAKLLYDNIFGSKSSRNSDLIEIRNSYNENLTQKNIEISLAKALLYKKKKKIIQIQAIAFSILGFMILLFLFIQNRSQRKKHLQKAENDELMIRLKSKELTSFTLQFIEKEKQIEEMSDFIKANVPKEKQNSSLLSNSEKNRSSYWEEFNNRFVSVNQTFYSTLSERYPELTSTDLKHCALIKLNFSAKEMAQLLGISASSVHTTHYRIRKKMGLEREVNLSNFISAI